MDTMFTSLRMLSFLCALTYVLSHATNEPTPNDIIDNFVKSLVFKHEDEIGKLEKVIAQLQEELRQTNERQGEVIRQQETQSTKPSDKDIAVISTYTRWGRKDCPTLSGAELVYSGYAAGAHYTEKGGGSNYVCLTDTPRWKYTQAQYTAGKQRDEAFIYGAEYEVYEWPFQGDNIPGRYVSNNDVPCAVCETAGRSTVLMIPGTYTCPNGWHEEYHGYLSANHVGFQRSEYVCVDGHPEAIEKGAGNENGALFYYAISKCGALHCPPYINNREVTCVVCSK